ncbi:MAG: hypothetical protein KFB93_01945 [Simkaniaceae bacterium]|nr:MAG: hypothetical protein KFB93_01945 [Simkaniaceae bacterium]
MNLVSVNHYIQNYLQPLAYVGSAYQLGQSVDHFKPHLIIGGANAMGTFAARKVGLSCIFAKLAVIGTTTFLYRFIPTKDNAPYTLAITHLVIASFFSFIDETVLYFK